VRLELDVFGDKQIDRELLRFAERAVDARPLWNHLIIQLRALEEEQFTSQGERASGGWLELAESTIARKAAKGREDPSRILYDTGALMHSVTDADGDNAVRLSTPDYMIFGTTVPYGRFHQRGEGVPRRRFLELTEHDRGDMFVRGAHRFLVTGTP
jgi:phage gpG-like protein